MIPILSEKVKSLGCHHFNPPLQSRGSIGVFDSGIGGLTVLREIRALFPHEHFIYLGDTARVPYGNKSRETVLRYCLENVDFLLDKGIKILVIACNTATVHAGQVLEERLEIPVIGVVIPGVEATMKATRNQRVAVLGTRGTLQSGVYQQLLQEKLPDGKVIGVPCPLFVPLVEEGMAGYPVAEALIKHYLEPLKKERIDTVLLGCTHYPLLRNQISDFFTGEVVVVDSAKSCAEALRNYLLFSESNEAGECCYYVSDDPELFCAQAHPILGIPIEELLLNTKQISFSPSYTDELSHPRS